MMRTTRVPICFAVVLTMGCSSSFRASDGDRDSGRPGSYGGPPLADGAVPGDAPSDDVCAGVVPPDEAAVDSVPLRWVTPPEYPIAVARIDETRRVDLDDELCVVVTRPAPGFASAEVFPMSPTDALVFRPDEPPGLRALARGEPGPGVELRVPAVPERAPRFGAFEAPPRAAGLLDNGPSFRVSRSGLFSPWPSRGGGGGPAGNILDGSRTPTLTWGVMMLSTQRSEYDPFLTYFSVDLSGFGDEFVTMDELPPVPEDLASNGSWGVVISRSEEGAALTWIVVESPLPSAPRLAPPFTREIPARTVEVMVGADFVLARAPERSVAFTEAGRALDVEDMTGVERLMAGHRREVLSLRRDGLLQLVERERNAVVRRADGWTIRPDAVARLGDAVHGSFALGCAWRALAGTDGFAVTGPVPIAGPAVIPPGTLGELLLVQPEALPEGTESLFAIAAQDDGYWLHRWSAPACAD